MGSNKPKATSTLLDPLAIPQHYHYIIFRRVAAYLIDVVFISGLTAIAFLAISISGLFTLGLGFTLIGTLLFTIPIVYHTFLTEGRAARPRGCILWALRFESGAGVVQVCCKPPF